MTAKIRPLLIRPGAVFTCHNDGLCCTDIHLLGPINAKEKLFVTSLLPQSVHRDPDFRENFLKTADNRQCVFRSQQRCQIHAKLGAASKPVGCQRFPFGLVATPSGGRVTTEHRCPCRTMGDRPTLRVEDVLPSLANYGRLVADARVEGRISLSKRQRIGFALYEKMESVWIERVLRGESPAKLLAAPLFVPLRAGTWEDVAAEFAEQKDKTAFTIATVWFSRALLALLKRGSRVKLPAERPWAIAFGRAERRSPIELSAASVFADWWVEELWSLDWTFRGSLDRARCEWQLLYAIANYISTQLIKAGTRADRAAAEAVMVVELVSTSPAWEETVAKMRIPNLPALALNSQPSVPVRRLKARLASADLAV